MHAAQMPLPLPAAIAAACIVPLTLDCCAATQRDIADRCVGGMHAAHKLDDCALPSRVWYTIHLPVAAKEPGLKATVPAAKRTVPLSSDVH
eukprot:scaffold9009_cov130-Isochrysis_galbana.AAC.2